MSGVAEQITLSTDEAATYAGVSRKSIYRAIADGRLRAARLHRGQRLRLRREWIDEWIEASIVSPRRQPVYDASVTRHQPRRGFLDP